MRVFYRYSAGRKGRYNHGSWPAGPAGGLEEGEGKVSGKYIIVRGFLEARNERGETMNLTPDSYLKPYFLAEDNPAHPYVAVWIYGEKFMADREKFRLCAAPYIDPL